MQYEQAERDLFDVFEKWAQERDEPGAEVSDDDLSDVRDWLADQDDEDLASLVWHEWLPFAFENWAKNWNAMC